MSFFQRSATKSIRQEEYTIRRPANSNEARLFDLRRLSRKNRERNEAEIRALCNAAYLGENIALCRALGRFKIYVDTLDFGLSPHIMLDGYWEMWVTETIAEYVSPGMIVADIGANIGYFTLLMAELVGPTGGVHAFEPNPKMVARLRRSADINGYGANVFLHQVALGDEDGGEMPLIIPDHEPKNAYVLHSGDHIPPEATMVSARRLDSESAWEAIEFAKIDVEGAEEMIWTGAEKLMRAQRLRTVILEFTPVRYKDPAAFLDCITAGGFAFNLIDPQLGVIPVSRDVVVNSPSTQDLMLLLSR